MSKRVLALALVVVLVAAGIGWWTERSPAVETTVVSRGSIDVTIQTVGTIQANGATVVRSTVPGVVQTLGVAAGDGVESGDILVILDRTSFQDGLDTARTTLTQAEYALQIAEGRSNASPDDNGLRLETLSAAQRVDGAQRALDRAQRALDNTVVVAPATGTVIDLPIKVGDSVSQSQPLARIAALKDMQLVADVDELDLPNVVIGATVTFRLDAYPERELQGVVRTTAPQARVQGGATVFATTVDYEAQPDLDIRPGMNADVTIVTASRQNVLLIPQRALKTVGDRSFVTVRTPKGNTDREVILGYRSQGNVEVVSGLTDGEVVVLH